MLSNSGWYVRERLREQESAWSVVAPVPESLLVDTASLPGLVQAEGFAAQKGIQTESGSDEDWSDDVGWIESGDWAEYLAKVPEAGVWYVHARVASNTQGGLLLVSVEGSPPETLQVPGTKGWQNWTTVVSPAALTVPAGLVRIRLDFVGGTGSLYNLNWISFGSSPIGVGPKARKGQTRLFRRDGIVELSGCRPGDRLVLRDAGGRIVARTEAEDGRLRVFVGNVAGMLFAEGLRAGVPFATLVPAIP
jgi:hypothetical protein